MIAKTTKRKSGTRRDNLLLAGKTVATFLLVIAVLLALIWHHNRVRQIGGQVQAKRAQLEGLRMQNAQLERQLEILCSPAVLYRRAADLRLGLVLPQPEQIMQIPARGLPGPAIAARPAPAAPSLATGSPPANRPVLLTAREGRGD
jgi:cell division protein FtsB